MDKQKKDFVLKKGVLGVGIPVGILMSVTAGFQVPGYIFRMQAFNPKVFLISLCLFVPIFAIAGYVWGMVVYGLIQKKRSR